jgi:membrane protein implicated in regulation of membrane protease activity
MDPLIVVEEKYHLVVTAGYAIVVGVIVLVLRTSPLERICLWLLGVIFFASVLRRIRKGVDGPPHFDL